MANYVRVTIKITPREDMTDEAGGSHVILSSVVAKNIVAAYDVPVGTYGEAGDVQGVAAGAPYYLAADKTTPLAISTELHALFVMLRHTGFSYDDAATLGTDVSTDYLQITMGASNEIVAILKPGEVWFTKMPNGSPELNCTTIKIKRVDELGGEADDAFDFAVEFWAFD